MIHRLVVLDRVKSVGMTLFDNGKIELQPDLLVGLVQALMLLGEEMGPSKGALREAELGKFQIGILSKEHLAYIIVQDSFDSEPFTSKILGLVIEEFHEEIRHANFNVKLENEEGIKARVFELLTTMKFPRKLLPKFEKLVRSFDLSTNATTDVVMLSDLDDGVVKIFKEPEDDNIIKILMEILSEIPFERHWIGESKLREPIFIDGNEKNFEAWVIYRVGMTDFCFMGRAFYNQGQERDLLVKALEELTSQAMEAILSEQGT